jgi:hypothetical protein
VSRPAVGSHRRTATGWVATVTDPAFQATTDAQLAAVIRECKLISENPWNDTWTLQGDGELPYAVMVLVEQSGGYADV